MIRSFGYATAVCVTSVLAVLTAYWLTNDSKHTSFEPWLLLAVFIPGFVIGSTFCVVPSCRPSGAWTFIASLLGIALLFYLDRSNSLLQYDRWIQRGMP